MIEPLYTFLAVAAYGALHSLLATDQSKRFSEDTFGPGAKRFYRLAYNIVGGLTFLPVLAVTAAYPGSHIYTIPWPWTLLSALGQLLAVGLLLASLRQTDPWRFLGLRQFVESESTAPVVFTTNGVYRHVRHPLYSAGLLFIWLTPVMTSSILALNIGVSLYLYIGSLFEERRLEREFGQTYVAYRLRVPRLIPGPWAKRPKSIAGKGS